MAIFIKTLQIKKVFFFPFIILSFSYNKVNISKDNLPALENILLAIYFSSASISLFNKTEPFKLFYVYCKNYIYYCILQTIISLFISI